VEGISRVCHDLRRPLTVIRGAATLLLEAHDQLPAANRAQILGLIDQSAQAMSDLVDDLTVAAQLESGRLELASSEVELSDLFSEAAEVIRKSHPGARLSLAVPQEVTVQADREQAVRVLRGLLSTAVRCSPEGAELEVGIEQPAAGQIRLIVAPPAGVVLPAGDEAFQAFSAAAENGLALHLSRGLARRMGGEVAVATRPGGGSAFSFTHNGRV
jgi:signal transduction histidine kinase